MCKCVVPEQGSSGEVSGVMVRGSFEEGRKGNCVCCEWNSLCELGVGPRLNNPTQQLYLLVLVLCDPLVERWENSGCVPFVMDACSAADLCACGRPTARSQRRFCTSVHSANRRVDVTARERRPRPLLPQQHVVERLFRRLHRPLGAHALCRDGVPERARPLLLCVRVLEVQGHELHTAGGYTALKVCKTSRAKQFVST